MGTIVHVPVQLGCDPELFLVDKTNGRIVGAEEVIPFEGLISPTGCGKIVRDGIQIELQPRSASCRENIASHFSQLFQLLDAHLKSSFPNVEVSFAGNVDVGQDTFEKCPSGRELGCMPSKNIHNPTSDLGVDGATYTKRSAGGHFHFGLQGISIYSDNGPELARLRKTGEQLYAMRESLVPLFDILMGNQGVLLDRDPLAAERRKVYGRAGEYRLPSHGIEYRTLSNFWLRSYQLFGLMAGLGRTAVSALWTDLNAGHTLHDASRSNQWGEGLKVTIPADSNLVGSLLNCVDINAVIYAINHNDFNLAWENWQQIKVWLEENVHFTEGNYAFPLNPTTIPAFERIVQDGVGKWFFEDPMQHWCAGYKEHLAHNGWERFTFMTMAYVQEWAKVQEAA